MDYADFYIFLFAVFDGEYHSIFSPKCFNEVKKPIDYKRLKENKISKYRNLFSVQLLNVQI